MKSYFKIIMVGEKLSGKTGQNVRTDEKVGEKASVILRATLTRSQSKGDLK